MKKFLLCFSILILVISAYPVKALASDGVDLSKFDIQTTINEDGSVDMEELITYNFNGNYNGAYRDISTKNTGGLYNLNVSFVSKNGKEMPLKQVTDAKNGDRNVFEVIKQDTDLYRIKIYYPSNDEKRTFKISYTMDNVAVKYKDTGEFFYTYWSDYNDTEINNLKIRIDSIIMPNTKNIRAYYHGISNGNISIKNGNIEYTFPHVNSRKLVETRVLFPVESIPLSNNVRNENGLSKILGEEAAYKEKEQRKIACAIIMKKIFNIISIILSFSLIISMIIVWGKFKEKSQNTYDTYSPPDIPEECSPAIAAYLVNRTINGRTIYATILDLWRKNYLNIKKVDPENKNDKVNFMIKKAKRVTPALLKHERHFISWIFEISNDKRTVTTSSIKEASKYPWFNYGFQTWLKLIKQEVKSKGYYDKAANNVGKWIVAASASGMVISIVSLVFMAHLGIFSLFISIFMMIYGIHYCIKRSVYGQLQYKKWIKFKKYINNTDFTYTGDTGYIEKYIPYAEALNMKKSSIIKLKNSFNDPSKNMGWIYYYLLFDNINLNKNEQFGHYVYGCFGTGAYGSSNSSSGGSSGGSAGGGGAGGF